MNMLQKLRQLEDNFVAVIKDPAVARLVALLVMIVTVVREATSDGKIDWFHVAIGLGTSIAAYGSIHRPNRDNPAADPDHEAGA